MPTALYDKLPESRDGFVGGVSLALEDGLERPVRGVFELIATYANGDVVQLEYDDNVIMDIARTNLSHLVVGDTVASNIITHIAFGSGGHDPGSIATALTVDPSNTTLTTEISGIRQPVSSYSFPAFNSVILTFQLGSGVGNGNIISEYGLITGGGTVFAKKTRGALAKDSDMILTINWTLVF